MLKWLDQSLMKNHYLKMLEWYISSSLYCSSYFLSIMKNLEENLTLDLFCEDFFFKVWLLFLGYAWEATNKGM